MNTSFLKRSYGLLVALVFTVLLTPTLFLPQADTGVVVPNGECEATHCS